jgi:hypothetical protein
MSTDKIYCLYETQISVAVTGIDHWVWDVYGFVDTYFESKEKVSYYEIIEPHAIQEDPLTHRLPPYGHDWRPPREYFFRVFETQIKIVLREWNLIVDEVEREVKQYVFLDFLLSTIFICFYNFCLDHLLGELMDFYEAGLEQVTYSRCQMTLKLDKKYSIFRSGIEKLCSFYGD